VLGIVNKTVPTQDWAGPQVSRRNYASPPNLHKKIILLRVSALLSLISWCFIVKSRRYKLYIAWPFYSYCVQRLGRRGTRVCPFHEMGNRGGRSTEWANIRPFHETVDFTNGLQHTRLSIERVLSTCAVKIKESRNRPGVTQRVPGGLGSQISWPSAREGGEVVSLTNRSPLPPGNVPGSHLH
jgi:hypothetical protein